MYENAYNNGEWTVVARAYLLHLIGCIISTDKSVTSVNVSYLGSFVDLRFIEGYSWAAAALSYMHESWDMLVLQPLNS